MTHDFIMCILRDSCSFFARFLQFFNIALKKSVGGSFQRYTSFLRPLDLGIVSTSARNGPPLPKGMNWTLLKPDKRPAGADSQPPFFLSNQDRARSFCPRWDFALYFEKRAHLVPMGRGKSFWPYGFQMLLLTFFRMNLTNPS